MKTLNNLKQQNLSKSILQKIKGGLETDNNTTTSTTTTATTTAKPKGTTGGAKPVSHDLRY